MATMPASVLFLLSQKRITPAIHALAHELGIMLDSVLERLAAPDSASIQIRTILSVRSHKSTTTRNLIDPILDVQTDWRWQKLKMTIDPTGRIAAAYGKQRQSHTFNLFLCRNSDADRRGHADAAIGFRSDQKC